MTKEIERLLEKLQRELNEIDLLVDKYTSEINELQQLVKVLLDNLTRILDVSIIDLKY